MDNSIDKNYSEDMEKRARFTAWINKIASDVSSMTPEERKNYLAKKKIKEEDFTGQYEEERKAVEGGEKAQPSPFMDALAMATPILTIASGIGGGLLRSVATALGGGPITQEVAEFIGSIAGALTPGGAARLTEKYGAEKAAQILEKLTQEMATGGEQKVSTLKKIIEEGGKEIPKEVPLKPGYVRMYRGEPIYGNLDKAALKSGQIGTWFSESKFEAESYAKSYSESNVASRRVKSRLAYIDLLKSEAEKYAIEAIGPKMYKLPPELASQKLISGIKELSEPIKKRLAKTFLDYDDSAIRGVKGFISEDLKNDFELAQKTHLDNLSELLNLHRIAEPAEKEILHNMIVDEFDKYLEVMTKKVQTINKNGKVIYQMVKQEFSQNDIDILGKQFTKQEMLDALDRIVNTKGQRGSLDARMFIFIKDILANPFRGIYRGVINAKLASPHVLGVKILSDALQGASQTAFQTIGIAGREALRERSLWHGLDAGKRNLVASLSAFSQMWPEAVRIAKLSFKTGEPEFEKMLGVAHTAISYLEGIDSTEPGMVANWLGHWYATGPRAVMTADQFAKTLNWRMELWTHAYYESLNQVTDRGIMGAEKLNVAEKLAQSFIDNLHEHEWLFEKALQGTYVRTFADSTGFSRALTALPDAVRIYFPFVRTKFNLFKEGMKFLPIAGMYGVWNGDGLELSSRLAKQSAGMLWAWYVYKKVLSGGITGKAPHVRPKGFNAYSAHIGGEAFGYQHIGQIAEPTKLIADAAQAYANAKPDDKHRLVDAIESAVKTMMLNTSIVPELAKFVHNMESTTPGSAIKYFLGEPVTGVIPTFPVETAREVVDPEYRQARSTVDEIYNSIPGLSSKLPPHLDEDGEPQYLPPGVSADDTPPSRWAVALDSLSPITVKHDGMDDVSKAELKYGIGGSRIPDNISYAGQVIPLTPEQKEQWGRLTGHELKIRGMNQRQYKQSILNDPRYQRVPEEQRDQYIKDDLKNAHKLFYEMGKTQMLMHHFSEQLRPPEGPTSGGLTQERPPSEVGFGGNQ